MSERADGLSTKRTGATKDADYLRGTLHGWPRAVVRWLILLIIRPFIKLTINGLENVPDQRAFLFVANHLHNADPILLETAITRPVHFMAKRELFRNRLLGHAARFVGAFPVERGRPDRGAIRRAEALLASGIAVGMFPEGTRSPTNGLQRGFSGAGMIALRTAVLVLPATITGTEALPFSGAKTAARNRPRSGRLGRNPIVIQFGQPFMLPTEVDGRRVNAAVATELMMLEIARLLPRSYRGMYEPMVDQVEAREQGRTGHSAAPSLSI
ncbi:MAG: 1-acyl-sn-glycerol-3-phosphate acyltransferase [Chloroflexota bacterium]|nr:1-acyl-sn-glycerol-3-phosphate acyltransferase [Chloroflexota bacterium]